MPLDFDRVRECGAEFDAAMTAAVGTRTPYSAEAARRFMNEEIEEFQDATSVTERVDAVIDALYYLSNAVARGGPPEWLFSVVSSLNAAITMIDLVPCFEIVHAANMSKFLLPGGFLRDGKWQKPPGFTPPDAALRVELDRQVAASRPQQLERQGALCCAVDPQLDRAVLVLGTVWPWA